MNKKLLNHFAEDNNKVFIGVGEYFQGDPPEKALFEVLNISETVLKFMLPLFSYALLPCHSERSAAESKNLLPTQVEKMLRLRSA